MLYVSSYTHTHTHKIFSLLLNESLPVSSLLRTGFSSPWTSMDGTNVVHVERNSTPRNPKLNSVVACSREIRRAHDVESCLRNYPRAPVYILATPGSKRRGVARFPRAIRTTTSFSLLRCDLFPLSSLVATVQSRPAHPALFTCRAFGKVSSYCELCFEFPKRPLLSNEVPKHER